MSGKECGVLDVLSCVLSFTFRGEARTFAMPMDKKACKAIAQTPSWSRHTVSIRAGTELVVSSSSAFHTLRTDSSSYRLEQELTYVLLLHGCSGPRCCCGGRPLGARRDQEDRLGRLGQPLERNPLMREAIRPLPPPPPPEGLLLRQEVSREQTGPGRAAKRGAERRR